MSLLDEWAKIIRPQPRRGSLSELLASRDPVENLRMNLPAEPARYGATMTNRQPGTVEGVRPMFGGPGEPLVTPDRNRRDMSMAEMLTGASGGIRGVLQPRRAWHAADAPFQQYDWGRLGTNIEPNVSGLSIEKWAMNLAKIGPWAHERRIGSRMGSAVDLPVELSGAAQSYASLDALERAVRRAGGPENFRNQLVARGRGYVSVADEEFKGRSFVGLTPETWRIAE